MEKVRNGLIGTGYIGRCHTVLRLKGEIVWVNSCRGEPGSHQSAGCRAIRYADQYKYINDFYKQISNRVRRT